MKHQPFLKTIFSALCVTLLLTACNKNGGGGGTPNNSDVMYPATLSSYEGNNSGYPANFTFKYDDKHHLTYMGNHDRFSNISSNGVQQVILTSQDTLIVANLFSGNIYTGQGVNDVRTNYQWKYYSGTNTTSAVITYYFTTGPAPDYRVSSHNGGTYTQFFTYDDNGNLVTSQFVTNAVGSPNSSSYDPGGLVYDKLTYKGYDNTKLSPYSAVAGYQFISYLWSYPWQFSLAVSKHNPTQVIEESLKTNTMKWSVYSQSDYTYIFNEQGYPSQIKITTVYPSTATPTKAFYQTYNFTYSK